MPHILNITPDFYWIGALDPTLRTFDIVMTTEFGTTYNAYLLNTPAYKKGKKLFFSIEKSSSLYVGTFPFHFLTFSLLYIFIS